MGEEMKGRFKKVCTGMSTEDIAKAVLASRHGDVVQDPMAVAALLKSWCG